jgi:hypothetical protein
MAERTIYRGLNMPKIAQISTLGGDIQTGEIDDDAVTAAKIGYKGGTFLIDSTTLTSAGTTITCTGMTTTDYDTLIVIFEGAKDANATLREIRLNLNADTGNNYNWSCTYNGANTNAAAAAYIKLGHLLTNKQSAGSWTISNSASYNKAVTGTQIDPNNNTNIGGGNWENTDKITEVKLTLAAADNFDIGSKLSVYGVKTTI